MAILTILICFIPVAQVTVRHVKTPASDTFPMGTYDERGLIAWDPNEVNGTPVLLGRNSYRSGHLKEATNYFLTAHQKNTKNLTAIQAYIIARREAGELASAVDQLDKEVEWARIRVDAKGFAKSSASLEVQLGVVYGYALECYEENRQQTKDRAVPTRPKTYDLCLREVRAHAPKTVAAQAMYLTALMIRDELAEGRVEARKATARFPKNYQFHWLLAQLYQQGVVSIRHGNGRWETPKEDEVMRQDLALSECEIVVSEHPEDPLAYYFAGGAALGQDNRKAKRYLEYFIDHSPHNGPRYQFAVSALNRMR